MDLTVGGTTPARGPGSKGQLPCGVGRTLQGDRDYTEERLGQAETWQEMAGILPFHGNI